MYFIRKFDPEIHHRKSIRLRGWDYTRPGLYFITINTQGIDNILFGENISGKLVLNEFGEIVQNEWLKTPSIRPYVELDEFIVMPDHFHGIVKLLSRESVGATCQVAPTNIQVAP
ncbi:MAG: transposase, partial [Bacteroidia bacterium]|nr:transposase [Bacteroidia bacterium]